LTGKLTINVYTTYKSSGPFTYISIYVIYLHDNPGGEWGWLSGIILKEDHPCKVYFNSKVISEKNFKWIFVKISIYPRFLSKINQMQNVSAKICNTCHNGQPNI